MGETGSIGGPDLSLTEVSVRREGCRTMAVTRGSYITHPVMASPYRYKNLLVLVTLATFTVANASTTTVGARSLDAWWPPSGVASWISPDSRILEKSLTSPIRPAAAMCTRLGLLNATGTVVSPKTTMARRGDLESTETSSLGTLRCWKFFSSLVPSDSVRNRSHDGASASDATDRFLAYLTPVQQSPQQVHQTDLKACRRRAVVARAETAAEEPSAVAIQRLTGSPGGSPCPF